MCILLLLGVDTVMLCMRSVPVCAALLDPAAVEALGTASAAGALEAAKPEAGAQETRDAAAGVDEWDEQDVAEGGAELEAVNDVGIAEPLAGEEAADKEVEIVDLVSQGAEGERGIPWHLCGALAQSVFNRMLTGMSNLTVRHWIGPRLLRAA